MTTISKVIDEIGGDLGGDLSVGRGQLGLTAIDSISANSVLWTDYTDRPHRFILTPTGADRTVTLPVVGTGDNEAQPGHEINILNPTGSSFNLVVETSATVTLQTVTPGNLLKVVADTAPATWDIALDITDIGDPTLQDAYDNSIAAAETGDINLNTGNNANGIGIVNTGDVIAGDILSVGGSSNYFNVKNITTTSATPAIQGLGGTANASNSIAIGSNASTTAVIHNNSVIFGDGTITATPTTTDQFKLAFTNGFQQVQGSTAPGTINTSPNLTRIQGSARTIDGAFNVFTELNIASTEDTNYGLDIELIASEAAGSSTTNGRIFIRADVVNDSNTLSIIGFNRRRIRGAGFTINARPAVSGTTIQVEVQGLAATTIDWRANMEIQEYKWN